MDPKDERELIGLEKEFWRAIQERDVDTALQLTSYPVVVAGASGVSTLERDKFAAMMKEGGYTLDSFELDQFKIRKLTEDVAIVAYHVREQVTIDGKQIVVDANDASTWVRHGKSWQCALHTESLKGDPFGRDRGAKA